MNKIFEAIKHERARQDEKWGGMIHDDKHTPSDWCRWIKTYTSWAELMAEYQSTEKYFKRMIQIAALVVAALESQNRKELQGKE